MRFLLFVSFLFIANKTFAAPGDTVWVSAHQGTWHSWYGNYDTMAHFPDAGKSFQRIIVEWTIGKYQCPGTPQYCSDWDYDAYLYLMPPSGGGDTIELARLITPYGRGPGMPLTWKHRYYFDVTDAYPLLHDSAKLRIQYRGYSGGFTSSVRFAFIEGTPARNVLSVKRLWTGGKNYGNAISIDSNVKPYTLTAPAGTQSAALKFSITGHGADSLYCAEFCSKWYEVKLNNTTLAHKDIWKNNCGVNNVYPQNGTWIYDRANWCPGEKVLPHLYPLSGVTSAGNYTLDVDFEPYQKAGTGQPSYSIEGQAYHYGAINRNLDLSLEEILSPTNYEGEDRSNPTCQQPKIRVKNLGATTITSANIIYSFPNNNTTYAYNATLSLAFNEEADIMLPHTQDLITATGDTNLIQVRIANVNGVVDDNISNNGSMATFSATPIWPANLRLEFRTNNTLENRWKLYDLNGNIVTQRNGTNINTWYYDTLQLTPGCYRLLVEDDGCDGLYWWANSAQGTGRFRVKSGISIQPLPMQGYFYGNNYEGDFGCKFEHRFIVPTPSSIGALLPSSSLDMEVVPNPAKDQVRISIVSPKQISGTIKIIDALGRLIYQTNTSQRDNLLSIKAWATGMYWVHYAGTSGTLVKKLEVAE